LQFLSRRELAVMGFESLKMEEFGRGGRSSVGGFLAFHKNRFFIGVLEVEGAGVLLVFGTFKKE
jgi:hypothetical protein